MSQLPIKTRAWIPEPLSAEVRNSVERLARLADVAHIALMPDVHLAERVCVGAVVATRLNRIEQRPRPLLNYKAC